MTLPALMLLAAATFANATVVSTDTTLRTLTIRSAQGPDEVLAVDGAALARLAELKPGDAVVLTVRTEVGRRTVTRIQRSARRARPAPRSTPRPRTDTVGPQQDPRRGAQQDPRVDPLRDPRVVPGLTVPASPGPTASPSPSPTPSPDGF